RLAAGRLGPADLPTDAELQAWLAAHPERFLEPARLTLTHVYLGRDRRGGPPPARAGGPPPVLRPGRPPPPPPPPPRRPLPVPAPPRPAATRSSAVPISAACRTPT